jgi:1-deoxy-D-xylulose-5-phosphate reductoisomerase
MKSIAILGSTGSIGQSSLQVMTNSPDRFRVSCLAVNKNIEQLQEQIQRFKPASVAVLDGGAASELRMTLNGHVRLYEGEEGLLELIKKGDFDVVISSFVGFAGLMPTLYAIEQGKTVALANKESLVVAGEIIMKKAQEHGARVIPIDSEHSAVLQCLLGEDLKNITRLILTASGGPFLHVDKREFDSITVEKALKHPNWKMGEKITIDSATLMNKGLEVIEAHWLFNLPSEKIEVVIHPQSIVHSMVEFVDGSVKAQMGVPDMKIPIQYALTYPERYPSLCSRIDFTALKEMTFFKPDLDKFECLRLAYMALREGGTMPTVLNAANEVAVEQFLARNIKFSDIPRYIRGAMDRIPTRPSSDIHTIIDVDRTTREFVRSQILN